MNRDGCVGMRGGTRVHDRLHFKKALTPFHAASQGQKLSMLAATVNFNAKIQWQCPRWLTTPSKHARRAEEPVRRFDFGRGRPFD